MKNSDFRDMVERLIKWAVVLVKRRLTDLARYYAKTRERMRYWFGCDDEDARRHLLKGFSRHLHVLEALTPRNIVRSDDGLDRLLGCVPNMLNRDAEAAHVCAPNTQLRLISTSEKFCTGLRDQNMFGDSRLSALIHEVTHFVDTFGSRDWRYGIDPTAARWAREHSDKALHNADTLTGFVVYGEDLLPL